MANIMNVTCFEILEGRDHSEDIGRDGNFIQFNPLMLRFRYMIIFGKCSLLPRCITDCNVLLRHAKIQEKTECTFHLKSKAKILYKLKRVVL
jgi:hypothetical protein